MKISSRFIRVCLLAFSSMSLFIVASSCKHQQQQTKYGPPSDYYQDQTQTKYGVITVPDTTITKYGVPVPENE